MLELSNPVFLLRKLIECPSVTPKEGGALDFLQEILEHLGFEVHRLTFNEEGTNDVENLYARYGHEGKNLMFAGHVDVVPAGADSSWQFPPFSGTIFKNKIYGRGAVDMKGGIAAFIAAFCRFVQKKISFQGQVSFVITGDEEGPAINGTKKILEWAHQNKEKWDAALVGEPTNPDYLGQMIKIGRRGSLSGIIKVQGQQGHVAYPHLAKNPLPLLLAMAKSLINESLDEANLNFPRSNLELTSVDTGNKALNLIPQECSLSFNVRFNDQWNISSLKNEIIKRLSVTYDNFPTNENLSYEIDWQANPSDSFITKNDYLIELLTQAVTTICKTEPNLSTSGGTSDARFIKNYCPVVEFGLVGKTMHKVDECASLDDLEKLCQIYEHFINLFFDKE